MTQQDIVEIVGASVFVLLMVSAIGVAGGRERWPLIICLTVCAAIGGFTSGEVRRRVKARRRES